MLIRQENSNDYAEVYKMIQAAFAAAEHSDGTEQDLVAALRDSDAFLPELSLVAEINGQIAGHILYTKAEIGGRSELALAPLSVSPAYQKQGVGSALMQEGHRIARNMGYHYVVVLGSETYYPRAGYVNASQLGIEVPDGIPALNFMALKLSKDAGEIRGSVTYAKEFGL